MIHPCSRVGHVFRKTSPYTFPGGTEKVLYKNKLRLSEVWMDEWKMFFSAVFPKSKNVNAGDLSERKQLRSDLGCKSFRWYLENVYPESSLPLNFYHVGDVVHLQSGMCLDTLGRKAKEFAGVSECHHEGGFQTWSYTSDFEIRNGDLCLDAAIIDEVFAVRLWTCHGEGGNQVWRTRKAERIILHEVTGLCLVVVDKILGLAKCNLNGDFDWWLPGISGI